MLILYQHAMGIEQVLKLMEKIAPGSAEPLSKYLEPKDFKLFIGFFKKDHSETLPDTVIIHPKHLSMVTGIKSLMYYPYFKTVWQQRQDYDDIALSKEYDSILDTYDVVYDNLSTLFPCAVIKTKGKQTRKVIFSDNRIAFTIDLANNKPEVISKVGFKDKRYDSYDINECINESKEIQFPLKGITLTVKDYVMVYYLIPYYKFLSIFGLVPQIRITFDQVNKETEKE